MATASKMTAEDRKKQAATIQKYRDLDIIPAMMKVKTETGVSLTTIATFNNGNSANKAIRDYYRTRFDKNKVSQEPDILELLAIWDNDIDGET